MKILPCLILLLPLASLANSQEVTVETDFGALSGTLQLPESGDVQAIALIIAGSGAVDRDGNFKGLSGKNNSLRMLAESLAMQGIGSLRYDKRLVGGSAKTTLNESTIRLDHYIADAKHLLAYLNQKYGQPTFVIGHSLGSLIGIAVAGQIEINGLVSISGAGRPASQILLEQLSDKLPADLMLKAQRVISTLDSGDTAESPQELDAIFRPSIQPYLISWFKYKPLKLIKELDMPIQIVQGTTDLQVTVSDAKLLHDHAPGSRIDLIDGMNHILKSISGELSEQAYSYSEPSLQLAPDLAPVIAEFILTESN